MAQSAQHKLRLSQAHRNHEIWQYADKLYQWWLQLGCPDTYDFKKTVTTHYPCFKNYRFENMVKTFNTQFEADQLEMLQRASERNKQDAASRVFMFASSRRKAEQEAARNAYRPELEEAEIDYRQLRQKKREWWDDD